jgi:putative DeoR family transcriptional regulator (stage III sporulation protein D)
MTTEYEECRPREERCEMIARSMIEQNATVRSIALQFGISKSTVHKDLVERLPRIHPGLYADVREILLRNKAERHLRGGEATRRKYLARKKKKS